MRPRANIGPPSPSTCALAVAEASFPPGHPDLVLFLDALAGVYQAQGKYAAAEPLYQRAVAIRELGIVDYGETALAIVSDECQEDITAAIDQGRGAATQA